MNPEKAKLRWRHIAFAQTIAMDLKEPRAALSSNKNQIPGTIELGKPGGLKMPVELPGNVPGCLKPCFVTF